MLDSYYDKENYFALSIKRKTKYYEKFEANFSSKKGSPKKMSRNSSKTQGLIKSLKNLSLAGSEELKTKR